MISEVLNALFFTYLLTEYLLVTNHSYEIGAPKRDWTERILQRNNLVALTVLVVINVLERVSGAASFLGDILQHFLHLPKICLVMVAYVLALYVDCQRVDPSLRFGDFVRRVGIAFCKVLPLYPFLAVFISFGFLLLINLFELLRLPLELLNWPIYYGTLYGPFSLVYWNVKQRIVDEKTTLPSCV